MSLCKVKPVLMKDHREPQRQKRTQAGPTAILDSILLACVIDAYEERKIASVDIPNAFAQTDFDLRNKDGSKKNSL